MLAPMANATPYFAFILLSSSAERSPPAPFDRPRNAIVVVTSVESGGSAEAAGLQRGDVIQEVNHEVVKTLEDYQKASSTLKKDELAVLLLSRQGNNLFVAVNPN